MVTTRESTTTFPDGRKNIRKETLDDRGRVIKIDIREIPAPAPKPVTTHVYVTHHPPPSSQPSSTRTSLNDSYRSVGSAPTSPQPNSNRSLSSVSPLTGEKKKAMSKREVRQEVYDANGNVVQVKVVKLADGGDEKKKYRKKKKSNRAKFKDKLEQDAKEQGRRDKSKKKLEKDAADTATQSSSDQVLNKVDQYSAGETSQAPKEKMSQVGGLSLSVAQSSKSTERTSDISRNSKNASHRSSGRSYYEDEEEDEFWSDAEVDRPGAVSVPGIEDDEYDSDAPSPRRSRNNNTLEAEVTVAAEVAPDTDKIIGEMQQRLQELEVQQAPAVVTPAVVAAETVVNVQEDNRNRFAELGYGFYG